MDSVTLPVNVDMPSVRILPSPNSQLEPSLHTGPMTAIRSLLLQAGYSVVDSEEAGDFTVVLELRSEHRTPQGNLGNFHTAYVEGGMTLRNASGSLVDQIILDRVKGVQLDPAAALSLALSNTAEALKEKHGNSLIRALR